MIQVNVNEEEIEIEGSSLDVIAEFMMIAIHIRANYDINKSSRERMVNTISKILLDDSSMEDLIKENLEHKEKELFNDVGIKTLNKL